MDTESHQVLKLRETLGDFEDYRYVGADIDEVIWIRNMGDKAMPPHEDRCICHTKIVHNHYLQNKHTEEIFIVGSTCKEQFLPEELRDMDCHLCKNKKRIINSEHCRQCDKVVKLCPICKDYDYLCKKKLCVACNRQFHLRYLNDEQICNTCMKKAEICELCGIYTFFCKKERCKVCRDEYHQQELIERMCENCLENTVGCKLCKEIYHKDVLKDGRCTSCCWKKVKTKEGKTNWLWKNFRIGQNKQGNMFILKGNTFLNNFNKTALPDDRLNDDNVWKHFEKFLKQLKAI